MKKKGKWFLCLALVLLLTSGRAYAVPPPASAICQPQEWAILTAANKERMAAGLAPLGTFDALQDVADIRAEELSRFFSHVRPDRTSCFTALQLREIVCEDAAENIARSENADAWGVHRAWMDSPDHRTSLMNPAYTHMGAGYFSGSDGLDYWEQMLIGGCEITEMAVQVGHIFAKDTIIDDMAGILTLRCSHGCSYMPLIEEMCTGYDPAAPGAQTITVTVCGQTAEIQVTVLDVERFKDVHPGDTYYEEILAARLAGLLLGVENGRFDPDGTLDRAMFTTALYRLAGKPETAADPFFLDVDITSGQWYVTPILWAAGEGIANGYPDRRFGIGDAVSREQMALMAYRWYQAAGNDAYKGNWDLYGYEDGERCSDYAREALAWSLENHFLEARGEQIAAWQAATRAEAAAFLSRLFKAVYG